MRTNGIVFTSEMEDRTLYYAEADGQFYRLVPRMGLEVYRSYDEACEGEAVDYYTVTDIVDDQED